VIRSTRSAGPSAGVVGMITAPSLAIASIDSSPDAAVPVQIPMVVDRRASSQRRSNAVRYHPTPHRAFTGVWWCVGLWISAAARSAMP
jgi:hypothetical protein